MGSYKKHTEENLFQRIKNKIFCIEESTPSHTTYNILGIKFHCLKSEIKKQRTDFIKYYQSFESASMIPKAEGTLRLVQEAEAGFLDLFQKFCEENNLRYWIDFGTLLGAIRHKGFIPWDDDIDIAMPRDDYERLISDFKDGFPNYPDFKIFFLNNKRNKCIIKIKHKNSKNLFIDIFPYDFYSTKLDKVGKQELSAKIHEVIKPHFFKIFKSVEQIRDNFKVKTKKEILNGKDVDLNCEPALFMAIDFPHNWKNKVYDWETIFPLKKIEFENKMFYAPNNPNAVLESIYGDYMKIPQNSYPRHSNYINIPEEEKTILEELAK